MTFASTLVQNFNYNQRQGLGPSTNGSFTWTVAQGVANINTTIKQFGTGSMFGNTSGGYIQTTTTNTFLNVGTGDFTIEGWLYIPTARNTALPGQNNGSSIDVIVNNATNGLGIRLGQTYQGNVNNISIFGRNGADQDFASYVWPLNQWNHFCAQRSGTAGGNSTTQISFWANGTKLFRQTGPGGTAIGRNFANSGVGTAMTIGSYNSGSPGSDEGLRNAYLDEICVTVGLARYDPQSNIGFSSTGVVGSIAGSGPWTANITSMTTTSGFAPGDVIISNTVSRLGTGTPTVSTIVSSTQLNFTATGGTTPVAGTALNIFNVTALNLAGQIVPPSESFVVDTATRLLMHMDGTSGSTTFTNATS